MSTVVVLNGSPSNPSTTERLLAQVAARVRADGHLSSLINIRELPAQALVTANAQDPVIAQALAEVVEADAVIVGSPIYKASYSGLLKAFVDLLPPNSLTGTPVLPFVTGGSPSHVLALDQGLKPLLAALGATTIARGRFVESRLIGPDGVSGSAAEAIEATVDEFAVDIAVRSRAGLTALAV